MHPLSVCLFFWYSYFYINFSLISSICFRVHLFIYLFIYLDLWFLLSFLHIWRLHFPSCTSQGGQRFLVKMAAPLTLLLIVAVTIRAALFRSSLAELIAERVEVVSPITAWKRGKRGSSGGLEPLRSVHVRVPSPPSHRCCYPVTRSNRFSCENQQLRFKFRKLDDVLLTLS